MKTIAIVTDQERMPLGSFLRKNLETVFDGYAIIKNFYLDDPDPNSPIEAHAVLVMTVGKAVQIRHRVGDPRRLLVVNRTIQKSEVYRICSIPAGTRVLVVNDTAETTLDFIALLYKIGIDHLELLPVDSGREYVDVDIAITPGERLSVPGSIGSVIDTGNRMIDVSTFIQLFDILGLAESELQRRLYLYSDNLVPLESGLDAHYRELYLKNLHLDAIVNSSRDGILLLNNEGHVTHHNRALTTMLGTESNIVGAAIADLVAEPLRSSFRQPGLDGTLTVYHGHSFLVTARIIEQLGRKSGVCFNLRDVTYERELEVSLGKRLTISGFTAQYRFQDIVTESPRMLHTLNHAQRFALSDLPVLVSGESGTGKELIAHSIHAASRRANLPFVAFNCAAVPESLIESELFGYEPGAFTGALKSGKAGLFEQANNGTIFLDEIGDMPYSLQAKLLRVLQERQVMRIGSQRIIALNVRVIAATNRDLRGRIQSGEFRADLYYRLAVLSLTVPPLRDRPEDIIPIFRRFLRSSPSEVEISPEAEDALRGYSWPGNVRELANVAAYASFLAQGEVRRGDLPEDVAGAADADTFSSLLDTLTTDGCAEAAEKVLRAMLHLEAAGRTSGRVSLRELLKHEGSALTEGRIRSLLARLSGLGLISSERGRGGSRLSPLGQAFTNWLQNRQKS